MHNPRRPWLPANSRIRYRRRMHGFPVRDVDRRPVHPSRFRAKRADRRRRSSLPALDFTDRNTCILFGDGAGAAVLTASEQTDRGIQCVRLYSDGSSQRFVQVPNLVTPQPADGEKPNRYVSMYGREVFRFAVCRMIELIEEARVEAQLRGPFDRSAGSASG